MSVCVWIRAAVGITFPCFAGMRGLQQNVCIIHPWRFVAGVRQCGNHGFDMHEKALFSPVRAYNWDTTRNPIICPFAKNVHATSAVLVDG